MTVAPECVAGEGAGSQEAGCEVIAPVEAGIHVACEAFQGPEAEVGVLDRAATAGDDMEAFVARRESARATDELARRK
jgi:hypothetical protein